MKPITRALMLGLATLTGLLLTSCQNSTPTTPAASARQHVNIQSWTGSPRVTALEDAGFKRGLMVPSGWSLDPYGAAGDGTWLGVSASKNTGGYRGANGNTWAIDTTTRKTWVYPQVNAGWYSSSAIAFDGYLVHQEKQQLSGTACKNTAADDCFRWRLYDVRLGARQQHLLAASPTPGSQQNSPIPALIRHHLTWLQGDANGNFAVESWTPGTPKPTVDATRTTFGSLHATGTSISILTRAHQALDGTWQLTRLRGKSSSPSGQFRGHPIMATGGSKVVYLPGDGSTIQQWRYGTLATTPADTTARTRPLPIRSFDAYAAGFIGTRFAYIVTDEQTAVIDLTHLRTTTVIAANPAISIPRLAGNKLTLIAQTPTHRTVIAWHVFPEAAGT